MPVTKAKPVWGAMAYADTRTGQLTEGGQQALAQWQTAINSIPISVTGEQAKAMGSTGLIWTLAHAPANGVFLIGVTAAGGTVIMPAYTIDGTKITTTQAFASLMASYEYIQ